MLCTLILLVLVSPHVVSHPLDPFTPQEIAVGMKVLAGRSPSNEPYFNSTQDRISTMYEQDPPKADVLAWKQGSTPLPRQLLVEVFKPTGQYIGVVDLDHKTVKSWRQIDVVKEGGNPVDSPGEFNKAPAIVLSDKQFVAALSRRGLKPKDVACLPVSWGGQWNASFAKEEAAGTRLLHIMCIITDNTTNPWFRPVPYLSAVIDSTRSVVLKIYDRGEGLPLPDPNDYDDKTLSELRPFPKLNPFVVSQPLGPSYSVKGHEVTWQSWKFHAKPHPRAGLILSQLQFLDPHSKKYRSIAYQIHPTELFVPYQTADLDYETRAYMDVGEYGLGVLTTTMMIASDCPDYATFMNGTVVASDGSVVVVDKALCMFERPSVVQAWRHTEMFSKGFKNARSQTELVMRIIATVGNYDYIIDIILKVDGTISVTTAATGIIEIEPTNSTQVASNNNRFGNDPWGTLVSPYHSGTSHDHFFCFRVDLDMDSPTPNRFVKENLVKLRLSSNLTTNPLGRKSIWHIEEKVVESELAARSIPDLLNPTIWNFRHSNLTSRVGNPVGYKLKPGLSAVSLMDEDDASQRRARFSKYSLWVTPQNDSELWAGGQNVYDSSGMYDGLGSWTLANRSIVDKDLVLWYTIGMHHVTRQEDGPVMPSLIEGFDLIPENFFQDNPALVLAPDSKKSGKSGKSKKAHKAR